NLFDPSNPSATTTITINLSNFAAAGTAQEWQLAAINPSDQTRAAITRLSDLSFTGNTITLTVPMESVSLFLLAPASSAPAAPSNLSGAAVSASQINLSWADNSANESGFVVERATNSTFTAGLTTANVGANVTSYSATGLAAGTTYWFRVRATNAGGASANSNVASATTQTVSTGTGTGLAATYFDNMDFTGTTVSRTDPTVNFNWGSGSPSPSIGPDTFSARWTGQVQAVESGSYRFRTNSDDGVRLWVNGQLIINNWTNHAPTTNTSAAVTLTAGQKYDIKLEYYENMGGAVM